MQHFTGQESRYCASTVNGCSVGFTPSKGSEAMGLLRQWPLLLLAFLLVTLITELAGAVLGNGWNWNRKICVF